LGSILGHTYVLVKIYTEDVILTRRELLWYFHVPFAPLAVCVYGPQIR
jgi:hypothetical protein